MRSCGWLQVLIPQCLVTILVSRVGERHRPCLGFQQRRLTPGGPRWLSRQESLRRIHSMIQSHDHIRKWLVLTAIAVAAAGICLLHGQTKRPQRITADDGWRRTSLGWERVDSWNALAQASSPIQALRATSSTTAKSRRWDTHPAALALIQLGAAVFALFSLPLGWRPGESGISRWMARFPRAIAASFRASAFY